MGRKRDNDGKYLLDKDSNKRKVIEMYKRKILNGQDRESAQLEAVTKYDIKMSSAVMFYTQAKKELEQ